MILDLFIPVEAVNPIIRLSGLQLYEFGEGVTSMPLPDEEHKTWLTTNVMYLTKEIPDNPVESRFMFMAVEVGTASMDGKRIFGITASRLAQAIATFEEQASAVDIKGGKLPLPKSLVHTQV